MFVDRADAGRQLAARLQDLDLRDPLVLAIPRGGVITGAALARSLGAELDVLLVQKVHSPLQPELALGAISEDGRLYLNPELKSVGVTDESLQLERDRELDEINRRRKRFRFVKPAATIAGRSVILTDDGVVTGSTILAGIEIVKGHRPHELIVAVPVAPPDRVHAIQRRCDRLICLHAPLGSWLGQFYRSFEVEDDEIVELLSKFGRANHDSE
jgi:predicted phosphoribosyltransferase